MELSDKEKKQFWDKVDKHKKDGCWLWTGGTTKFGHGRFQVNGRLESPHRIAWNLYYGSIPENKFVCHHCDTPACVNPEHLFVGTRSDNMLDASKKGRLHIRENPKEIIEASRRKRKLNKDQVFSILNRLSKGEAYRSIARSFSVGHNVIGCIDKGKTYKDFVLEWKDLKGDNFGSTTR